MGREQPDHAKALYRRGMTYAELHSYEAAAEDLAASKEANPSSAAEINRTLARLKAQDVAASSKQKNEFKNFFERK